MGGKTWRRRKRKGGRNQFWLCLWRRNQRKSTKISSPTGRVPVAQRAHGAPLSWCCKFIMSYSSLSRDSMLRSQQKSTGREKSALSVFFSLQIGVLAHHTDRLLDSDHGWMNSQVTDTQAIDFNSGWPFYDPLSLPTFTSAAHLPNSVGRTRVNSNLNKHKKADLKKEGKNKGILDINKGE